jgi:hypothetical protein
LNETAFLFPADNTITVIIEQCMGNANFDRGSGDDEKNDPPVTRMVISAHHLLFFISESTIFP